MKALRFLIVFSFLLLLGGSVFAQQSEPPTITLNVPLQFSDLHPDVNVIRVTCNAYDGSGKQIAYGRTDTSCPDSGDLNQTVTVVLTQDPHCDITTAVRYIVVFSLGVKGTYYIPSPTQENIQARVKEGTTFVPQVSGNITW
jgi:hypothetical protein